MRLESMYQEVILDHYRHPNARGLRDNWDAEVHHHNTSCGDDIRLRVHLDHDPDDPHNPETVSYTHLTLPTIYSV